MISPSATRRFRRALERCRIERHLPWLHAARLQVGGRALDELLRFHLDQRLRQLQWRGIEQRLQRLALDARIDAFFHLALDVGADLAAILARSPIGDAELLGELGVERRQLRFFDAF